MKILFILVVIFCGIINQASGHGRMMDPVARSSAWRVGYAVPHNYDDNALFCGGFANKQAHGGKCGVCGDPWNGRRDNEAGGKYATGVIVKTYKMGQVVTLKSEITANHFGWMEYRICPNNDVTKPVTQECLDRYVLQRADGQGSKVMLNNRRTGMWSMDYVLPAGMTCTQCVIQWKYHAGNSWGVDPKSGKGCVGCGPQEEFYGCADVSIQSDSAPVVVTNAPRTPAPTQAPVIFTNRPTTQRPVTQRPTTQQPVFQTQTPKEFIGARITYCVAINNWAGDKQMDQWCTDNCFVGSCPPYACDCSGGAAPTTKTTTTTTTTTTPKPTTQKPTTPTTKSTTTTTTTTPKPTTPKPTTPKPTTPKPTTPRPTTTAPATQQPQMTTLDPNVQIINRVECKAVNLWQGNEYLDRWCADACAHGNCPPEQCECVKVQRFVTRTTTTTEIPEPLTSTPNPAVVTTRKECEAISVWKGIQVFDMWCTEQCNDPTKLCPEDTCLCKDVAQLPGKSQTTKRPTTTTTTTTKKPDVTSYTTCVSNGVVAGDYWNGWCQNHCNGGFCPIDYCNCM